jgi:hypothetical protein
VPNRAFLHPRMAFAGGKFHRARFPLLPHLVASATADLPAPAVYAAAPHNRDHGPLSAAGHPNRLCAAPIGPAGFRRPPSSSCHRSRCWCGRSHPTSATARRKRQDNVLIDVVVQGGGSAAAPQFTAPPEGAAIPPPSASKKKAPAKNPRALKKPPVARPRLVLTPHPPLNMADAHHGFDETPNRYELINQEDHRKRLCEYHLFHCVLVICASIPLCEFICASIPLCVFIFASIPLCVFILVVLIICVGWHCNGKV